MGWRARLTKCLADETRRCRKPAAADASRLRAWIETHACICRALFDCVNEGRAAVLVVGAFAALAGAAAALVQHHAWNGCPSPQFSFLDFELTFSARTFASLLDQAGDCRGGVVWSLLSTDVLFPITYALFLSALYLWAERYRRFRPGVWQDRDTSGAATKPPERIVEPALPLLSSILVLLPFAVAILDVFAENLPLFGAAKVTPGTGLFEVFVMVGSYGAAFKWTLLALFALGLAGMVVRGPRKIVLWRIRYSVLAVLLGALPLQLIPQGQDIMQRLVEGKFPLLRIVVAVFALAGTALVIWYCARALTRVRLASDSPRSDDPWLPFFERNIPRMVGIAVLALSGMAFAKAGLALSQYLGVAIGTYSFIVLIAALRPQWLCGIGRHLISMVSATASKDSLLTERFGRAALALVLSITIVWPVSFKPWVARYDETSAELFYLRIGAALSLAVAWILYLIVYFRRDVYVLRRTKSLETLARLRKRWEKELAAGVSTYGLPVDVMPRAIGAALVSAMFFVLFTFAPVDTGRSLGPLVILALTTANAVFVGSLLAYFGRKCRLPLVVLLLALAAVFSRWNDNHVIRTLPPGASDSARAGTPKLANRLTLWLNARQAEHSDSIPLVLVAAAGGGLRAAYWTATALATLQDRDSAFARHVFAISAVSGGSVGATVFTAMVHDRMGKHVAPDCVRSLVDAQGPGPEAGDSLIYDQPRPMAACVRRLMSDDFLSPVLAKFVAPDFLQWFLPFPVPRFDRSLALEQSWERSYAATLGDSTMQTGFRELLSDSNAANGVPSLLLNTTHVETGRRYVTAPFDDRDVFLDAPGVHDALGADLRLSTAAHNSARFTYISPAGRIERGDGGAYGALVDGGYFENSGLATLNDLRRALVTLLGRMSDTAAATAARRVRMVILYLCNDPLSCRRDIHADSSLETRRSALGEWFAPGRALFAARDARGSLARAQIAKEHLATLLQLNVCESLTVSVGGRAGGSGPADSVVLDVARERVVNPPLGWLLSGLARRWMDSSLVLDTVRQGARIDIERLAKQGNCRARNVRTMDSLVSVLGDRR